MKAVKGIFVGLLLTAVLFLSVYALFPTEDAEPTISHIVVSADSSKESQPAIHDSSEESSSSKPPKKPSSSSSSPKPSSSSESSGPEIALPLNINTATEEELRQIDGITPELARLIVLYREMAGGYTTTEDLKKIVQLGYNTYDKIKDSIICE